MIYYGIFEAGELLFNRGLNGDVFRSPDEAAAFALGFEGVEVAPWQHVPSAQYITFAPRDYDGFGTHTLDQRPDGARLVDVPDTAQAWQRSRYASGGFSMQPA